MRLIDADELRTRCTRKVAPSNNSDFIKAPTWNDAMSIIDDAPTVDPVQHGRWITSIRVINDGTKSRAKVYTECKCSVCGGVFGRMSDLFCYRCGAKMDEEGV